MKYFAIILVTLVIIGYILWQYGKRPAKHKITALSELTKYFKALLYRGYNRGFLVIERPTKDRFIQFSKYITDEGKVGLQFDFPRAHWSTDYCERLKDVLKQRGYQYEVQKIGETGVPGSLDLVSEFIEVDLRQDLKAATELARLALLDVLGIKPDEPLILYFVNISPKDERIGF